VKIIETLRREYKAMFWRWYNARKFLTDDEAQWAAKLDGEKIIIKSLLGAKAKKLMPVWENEVITHYGLAE